MKSKIIRMLPAFFLALVMTGSTIANDDEMLNQIFDDYREYIRRNYPEGATYEGDHRYDDKVTDNSKQGILARLDSTRGFLERINALDEKNLSHDNKLNYYLFKRQLEEDLEFSRFRYYLMPIGQQYGVHIDAPQLAEVQPLSTAEDYQKYFARLRMLGTLIDNDIANMREGMLEGIVMPYFIMEKTLPQMENVISKDADSSIFFSAMNKGDKLTPEERASIANELREIISQEINPGYQRLHDFVKNEYLPGCRKEAGVWSLPDGSDRYNMAVKYFTTLDMTYDEVHEKGLQEVARIETEMQKIADSLNFIGSVQEFNDYLRSDPSMYFTDKEDLMNGYREILREMDAKLQDLFGRLPEAPYDLKEIEEFRAKSAPMAYYYSAPEDRSRPGYFYVNTYDLSSRPKYVMTALALHEAVPGHHLQISIAQELDSLPEFRKNGGYTAFVEGWGLYAESLGYEAGMYEDLYQLYGALVFEMWRACRLVVDTGIHGKRWTRDEAVEFMKKYTANSEMDINSEVDRYIAWPGQALAYKIGELKIKELRAKAENALGDKFDVREFHDTLLKNGALPLPLIEMEIDNWIASKSGS